MINQIWAYYGDLAAELTRAGQAAAAGIRSQPQQQRPGGGAIGILYLKGLMTRERDWWYGSNAGTDDLVRDLNSLVASPSIGAVLMYVNSPGGMSDAGLHMSRAVAAASVRNGGPKPIYALIETMGASAAYWAASQADKVWADPAALSGSIGTYTVLRDYSKLMTDAGIKTHVIKTGKFKGAGVVGTEVDAELLSEAQRIVDHINEGFLSSVASARRLSIDRVRAVADGRVHTSRDAQSLGLIDGITTFDGAIRSIATFLQSQAAARQPTTTAEQRWNDAIQERIDAGMSRHDAARAVAIKQPELQREYLTLVNEKEQARQWQRKQRRK